MLAFFYLLLRDCEFWARCRELFSIAQNLGMSLIIWVIGDIWDWRSETILVSRRIPNGGILTLITYLQHLPWVNGVHVWTHNVGPLGFSPPWGFCICCLVQLKRRPFSLSRCTRRPSSWERWSYIMSSRIKDTVVEEGRGTIVKHGLGFLRYLNSSMQFDCETT